MVFLEQEKNIVTKQDIYLAQIAAEIRRSFVKNPETIKIEHFIRKFETIFDEKGVPKEELEVEVEERPKEVVETKSKSAWLKFLGIKK